jgi:hypothetical protein
MKSMTIRQKVLTLSITGLISSCGREDHSSLQSQIYEGSNFAKVWSEVNEGPYREGSLAEYKTSYSKFFEGSVNLLERAVNRTLSTPSDTLPRFQKLLHPIGICFAGTWTITEDNPYTGYFANGSKAVIIMRASEAMGNATTADWRAFGLAGKLYPTTDEQDPRQLKTANFFTVDDLGGTDSQSFLDLPKTNKPASSIHASSLFMIRTLKEIVSVFTAADNEPGVRQLYPIAELGLKPGQKAVIPIGFMLKSENSKRTGIDDFRQELQLKHYANGLNFGIYTSDGAHPAPKRLGSIHLTRESLSDGCDHRLHFPHPRNR